MYASVPPNSPSPLPFIIMIVVLVLLLLGLGIWLVISLTKKCPTCPICPKCTNGQPCSCCPANTTCQPTPVTPVTPVVPVTPVTPTPTPVTPGAVFIYGNPTGAAVPSAGTTNALTQTPAVRRADNTIETPSSLVLGPPNTFGTQWRIVTVGANQYLQSVSSGQFLVVSPGGVISFTPTQTEATALNIKQTGVTGIATSVIINGVTTVLGLTALATGKVVAQPISQTPDLKMAWLVAPASQ